MTGEMLNRINETIENYVRPSLQMDGGDIEVVDFKDNVLSVRLSGACSCCPHARETLKSLVANSIHQYVSGDIIVRAV